MGRADNLRNADPSTVEARKTEALALLRQGVKYKEIVAVIRSRYGVGIGYAFLTKERARMIREAQRAERKAKRSENGGAVAKRQTVAEQIAGLDAGLVARLCGSGLRCILRADGSIEVKGRQQQQQQRRQS